MSHRIYTEDQLNQLCKQYQKVLRIQDWDVEVQLVHQSELETSKGEPIDGQHNSSLAFQKSIIRIPTSESWQKSLLYPTQDMQATLLHELVHLVFDSIGPNEKENSVVLCQLWEQGIEKIALALQNLLGDPPFPPEEPKEERPKGYNEQQS